MNLEMLWDFMENFIRKQSFFPPNKLPPLKTFLATAEITRNNTRKYSSTSKKSFRRVLKLEKVPAHKKRFHQLLHLH